VLKIRSGATEHVLDVGDWATFGRAGESSVDIEVADDDRLHRRLGQFGVAEDGWILRNVGRWLHLHVFDEEGPGNDTVRPGVERRIPWRLSRVELRLGDCSYGLSVRYEGRFRPPLAGGVVGGGASDETRPTFRLDRRAGYFRALVALCEPGLRPTPVAVVPSNAEIAATLNRCGAEPRCLTAKTIERRLDYCSQLLGLKGGPGGASGPGLERRDLRARLAEVAVATGSVTALDLAVLDG
jgi:hypothetical protein